MIFDAAERRILDDLADILIPRGANASASDAGVSGPGLDAVLLARPDLAVGLKALLRESITDPRDRIAHLRRNDRQAFNLLTQVVAGAYFLNPEIRKAVNYRGQPAKPFDSRTDYVDPNLLRPVLGRGSIYRPTPPG